MYDKTFLSTFCLGFKVEQLDSSKSKLPNASVQVVWGQPFSLIIYLVREVFDQSGGMHHMSFLRFRIGQCQLLILSKAKWV